MMSAKNSAKGRTGRSDVGNSSALTSRRAAFDPFAVFPFAGDDVYILCSDGLVGVDARQANEGCCRAWKRLAAAPDRRLGKLMVALLKTGKNGDCLRSEEKVLIEQWKEHQLRYVVETVVEACEEHGFIDPHITKLKIAKGMQPFVWTWVKAHGKGHPWGPGCGVYIVFCHAGFKNTLPGKCGRNNPSLAERAADAALVNQKR